jgi:hypothetical protein
LRRKSRGTFSGYSEKKDNDEKKYSRSVRVDAYSKRQAPGAYARKAKPNELIVNPELHAERKLQLVSLSRNFILVADDSACGRRCSTPYGLN